MWTLQTPERAAQLAAWCREIRGWDIVYPDRMVRTGSRQVDAATIGVYWYADAYKNGRIKLRMTVEYVEEKETAS